MARQLSRSTLDDGPRSFAVRQSSGDDLVTEALEFRAVENLVSAT
jgi:hypothetical protein